MVDINFDINLFQVPDETFYRSCLQLSCFSLAKLEIGPNSSVLKDAAKNPAADSIKLGKSVDCSHPR